jgi:DNA-binding MarR family transcriptional regulator
VRGGRRPDPDETFLSALWSFSKVFGGMTEPALRRHRLTNGEFFLLVVLKHERSPTVGGVAEKLGIKMPGVTQLVNSLEGRGAVRRDRSTSDRRVVRLAVTPAGSALIRGVERSMLRVLRRGTRLIPAESKLYSARVLNEAAGGLAAMTGRAAADRDKSISRPASGQKS